MIPITSLYRLSGVGHLILILIESADCAPIIPPPGDEASSRSINITAYISIIASVTSALVLLFVAKLRFLQLRKSGGSTKLDHLWLSSRGNAWRGALSDEKRSPFWLGFLGSPEREVAFFSGDLMFVAPSGRLLKRRYERHSLKRIFNPTPSGVDSPAIRQTQRPVEPNELASTFVTNNVLAHLFWHELNLESETPSPCHQEISSKNSFPRLSRNEPLALSFPSSCRTPDRRRVFYSDTSNVIGDLGFSASKAHIEGDSYSPWFSSSLAAVFGPVPGNSFVDNLESSSPMPLRFRLPSPLLPARKKSGSSNTHPPLRSLVFSEAGTGAGFLAERDLVSSTDVDMVPPEIEKLSQEGANPYTQCKPPRSPGSSGGTVKDSHEYSTLEDMLDQLAQATCDWDESILIDDKFKTLINRNNLLSSPDPCIPFGVTKYDASYDLPEESVDEHAASLDSSLLVNPSGALRDRTRDLLFSIPEEEAISLCDVLIQSY